MKYLLLFALFFQIPERPTNYVTDPEDILSLYEEAQLNEKLKHFEDSTTNQIFIYIDKRMHGSSIEDQSKKIFNKWGVGQKNKNNGVLMAIFVDDREHRIQVGYGLEKALPSSLCLEILDEDMAPYFKEGKYYKGINTGVDKLIFYTKHEFVPGDPNKTLWIAVAAAFAINVLFAVVNINTMKKWKAVKRRKNYIMLAAVFLFAPLLGPGIYLILHSTNGILLSILPFAGALASILLCITISDGSNYDLETDDMYQRRMYDRRSESSSSSNDSVEGGGGSSGDGGASSHW